MIDKRYDSVHQYINQDINNNKQNELSSIRLRWAGAQQRKQLRQRIFGQHFNYTKVSLNKEKKYLIQEEKNTEIERANRILLEKIQRIAKRSLILEHKRAVTEEGQRGIDIITSEQPKFEERTSSKSQHRILKIGITPLRAAKRKILFQGTQQLGGESFFIIIFIERDQFILSAEWRSNKQKITMDLNSYHNLLQGQLHGDPKGIITLLRFNGTMLELTGIKKQQIILEENQEVTLPLIGRNRQQENFTK